MNKKTISINDAIDIIKEKLINDGEVVITVTGNSMLPFMKDKETLVTLEKPKKPLKRGDVVFYHNEQNIWILHRILKVKKDLLIICGDALNKLEYINSDWVIGIMKDFQNKDKITLSNNKYYKFKVRLWMLFRPIRRYLFAISRRLKRKNDKDA